MLVVTLTEVLQGFEPGFYRYPAYGRAGMTQEIAGGNQPQPQVILAWGIVEILLKHALQLSRRYIEIPGYLLHEQRF